MDVEIRIIIVIIIKIMSCIKDFTEQIVVESGESVGDTAGGEPRRRTKFQSESKEGTEVARWGGGGGQIVKGDVM